MNFNRATYLPNTAYPGPQWKRVLLLVLSICAVISLARGFQNAVVNSQDMQWSVLVVFWQDHLDPYRVLLDDPHSAKFILSQGPNNLHFLNFVLAPLAFMNFSAAKIAWATANLIFVAGALWIFRTLHDVRMPIMLGLIFLCSAPLRNALGNGQLSLFCLLFYALYLMFAERRPILAAMFAGLGSGKYNLGAPLFFQMRLKPANILAFGAIPFAAVVYWCVHFHVGFIEALFLPIKVAAIAVGPRVGVGDFLMLVRAAGMPPLAADMVAAVILVAAVLLQRRCFPTNDRLLLFAFYATLSLWLVYHGAYDFVFLLPAAIVAARSKSRIIQNGLIAGIAYFWFLAKALLDFGSVELPQEFNLAVLLLLQFLLAWEIRIGSAEVEPGLELRPLGSRDSHVFSGAGCAKSG